ncbi:MAG TPA: hypothetical protein VFU54_01030, partial [Actinomycetota bacterium]|nr:hypothetical protein [Actinomycetota bacterium]
QPRLAGAAREALLRLADDDSRRVSAAAHAALARSGEPAAVVAPPVREPDAARVREAPPVPEPDTAPVREAPPLRDPDRGKAPPAPVLSDTAPPPASAGAAENGDARAAAATAADAATREPTEAPPVAAPPEERPAPTGGEPDRRRQKRVAVAGVAAAVVALTVAAFLLVPDGTSSTSNRTSPTAAGPTATSPTQRRLPGSWEQLPLPPVALESSGTAAFGKRIYMAGGFDKGRHPSTALLIYDPARRAWSSGPALPAPISHGALVSTGKELLLIGGYHTEPGKDTPLAAVRRLRRGASAWTDGPPLPAPLAAGAAAWDGRRVVFAGGVDSGLQASADVFALEGDKWRRIRGALSKPREHLAAATDGNGNVWFLAGEAHDPAHPSKITRSYGDVDLVNGDTVKRVGALRSPLGSLAGFWSEKTGPCVLGGRDIARQLSRTVQCLDRGVSVPALSTKRHGMGAAVVDDVLYGVGGAEGNHHADLLAGAFRL